MPLTVKPGLGGPTSKPSDFMSVHLNDVVRGIVQRSDDVWHENATEIQTCCYIEGVAVPDHLRDFVDSRWSRSPADVWACLT
jgi:hypothetical protein